MIGKLFKFDFRTSVRQVAIAWIGIIASSALLSIVIAIAEYSGANGPNPHAGMEELATIFTTLAGILYGVIIVATFVITILIIVLRFYRGMCDEEGYLLHTLPVTTRSIIVSKGLVATAITTISMLVALLSVFIIALGVDAPGFLDGLGRLFSGIAEQPVMILIGLLGFIVMLLGILGSVYQVYASIAIGQIANKNRVLFAVLAYIAIGMILSAITVPITVLWGFTGSDPFTWMLENMNSQVAMALVTEFAMLAIEAIHVLIFHVISEVILTRKLNLL